jgi:gluconate 2-dehydrogenase subunit 3-like protein
MPSNSISRRDILKTLAMGAVGGSVLQVIPLEAAEHVHHMVQAEKRQTPAGKYQPKLFNAHQYATLAVVCDAIIPPDGHSGGAVQAGAPEFIDLLTSENKAYQATLVRGLDWLDAYCNKAFGKALIDCDAAQRKQVLDLIAFRKSAVEDSSMGPGVEFFAFTRRLTTDAFYTSEIGIKDLQYIGNTFLPDFPGCPPVPES